MITEAKERTPCVYFVSDGCGHCKIGVASNLPLRMSSLQVGNAYELKIINVIYCETVSAATDIERKAHQKLERSAIRGEWFDENDVIDFLSKGGIQTKQEKEIDYIGIIDILNKIDITTEAGKRDHAILVLFLNAFPTTRELSKMDICDYNRSERKIHFIPEKNTALGADYLGYFHLHENIANVLNEYIDARKETDKNEPLFVSVGNRSKGKRLSESSICRLIKARMEDAGFVGYKNPCKALKRAAVNSLFLQGFSWLDVARITRLKDSVACGIMERMPDDRLSGIDTIQTWQRMNGVTPYHQ